MVQWKLQLRNKIEDSNIEEPVKELQAGDDAELSDLAQRVSWAVATFRFGPS